MQSEMFQPTITAVRRLRGVYAFDSRESALRWSVRNVPRTPPGAVCVAPPRPKDMGGSWWLIYPVTHPGHVRYYVLGKSGALLRR